MCDYAGLNFINIGNLDVFDYFSILRDAVIYKYMQTEEGREYLDKCFILEQTKPDRKRLREKFGKEGTDG